MIRRSWNAFFFLFVSFSFALSAANEFAYLDLQRNKSKVQVENRKKCKIAFVQDSSISYPFSARKLFEKEIIALLGNEYEILLSEENAFCGNNTRSSIEEAFLKAYQDETIDIVVAFGILSSHFAASKQTVKKPTFAPFIIDPVIQNIQKKEGISGIENINYLSSATDIAKDIRTFKKLVPIQLLAVVMEEKLLSHLPEIEKTFYEIAKETKTAIIMVPVPEGEDIIRSLPENIEGVYITPLFQQSKEKLKQFSNDLIEKKIPSFTLFSQGYTDIGFLASSNQDANLLRIARRLALNIEETLCGENPCFLPTEMASDQEIVLNMETARKLEVTPSWEFFLDAHLLFQDKNQSIRFISLPEAIMEGLKHNLTLNVFRHEVLAGKQEVQKARAKIYPQLGLDSKARTIDQERARASKGTEPQNAVYFGSSFSQMLYSNHLLGNIRIQKSLQTARIYSLESARLDIIFEITKSYLNVLRELTLEKIQRNNLILTKSNLRVAKQRVRIGSAKKNEVYRWESEISSNKTNVIASHFRVENQKVTLNQLLNRPQQEQVDLEEIDLNTCYFPIQIFWVNQLLKKPKNLEYFSGYLSWKGCHLSPELRELENKIKAQREVLGVAKRDFYVPDIFLGADCQQRIYQSGAASKDPLSRDRTEYQVGIQFSFPLYKGGEKIAEKNLAFQKLLKLQSEWQRLFTFIEETIRIRIQNATASYQAIDLAEEAEESALKNLELIKDSYFKGTATMIDLLDAQNQALNAKLVTTNAVYDFFIDLMALQRAIGQFDFEMTEEEKGKFWNDLYCKLEQKNL